MLYYIILLCISPVPCRGTSRDMLTRSRVFSVTKLAGSHHMFKLSNEGLSKLT